VKYDASSTGGILNVILKKNDKPGYNGIAMASVGSGNCYMGMTNLNVKEGNWNFFGIYTFNYGSNTSSGYTQRQNVTDLFPIASFEQWNNTLMTNMFHFARAGFDYNINNRNSITLSGNYISGSFDSQDNQNFGVFDSTKNLLINGDRVADQTAGFKNYTGQLQYKRTWPKAGKELTADAMYNYMAGDGGFNWATNNYYGGVLLPNNPQLTKNINLSNAHMMNGQIDYVNPISDTKKIEWGFKSNYTTSISNNTTYNYVYADDAYEADTSLSNNYQIENMINAAYVNYTGKFKKIGYVGGLRFEQSYYKGIILNKNQSFGYNYPSNKDNILNALFPAIYLSHKFKGKEIQANFSRKINRPNFFQLMPFIMFSDKYNLRRGNPDLAPEFINMAEVNFNVKIKKVDILTSVYGKYITQPITNVAYPLPTDPSVLLNTYQNGHDSYNFGWENTFKFTIWKSFSVMSNTNVYYQTINFLNSANQLVVNEGYSWMTKLNLSYKLPKDFTIQMNGTYESPKIIPQGKTIPMYFMDLSLGKNINQKYIFNLTLSDVFNTKKMGSVYNTPDYIQTLNRRRETRFVRLSFTWLFGKFDTSIFKRRPKSGDTPNMGGQDGLDFGK
ncbi:MAG: TonB-dependent receptor family protein, partial [Bacteroidia bacterium]|nr:TonB-dependent receptor family protein [Bacteroidia bacterium]